VQVEQEEEDDIVDIVDLQTTTSKYSGSLYLSVTPKFYTKV